MNKTLQVGYISKAHGIKGEVLVSLISNVVDRIKPGSTLYCEGTPLCVNSSSPHKGNWIVRFEGIDSRTAAETLRSRELQALPIEDAQALWVDDMVGLTVIDQAGTVLGKVVALEANPASDLLVLESGHVIPLVFLDGDERHYRVSGALHVTIPDGLLEAEF